jgi:hypothetical protein
MPNKDSAKLRELFKKHAHYEHSGGNTLCTSFDQQELEELLKDIQAHIAARLDTIEFDTLGRLIPNFDGIGTIGYEFNDGSCISVDERMEQFEEHTDQYKCQSYYDDNNVLQDCTCGACK